MKKIFIILLFILIVFNILALIKITIQNNEMKEVLFLNSQCDSISTNRKYLNDLFRNKLVYSFKSVSKNISDTTLIIDKNNKKINIKALITSSPKLIFRYSVANCRDCINRIIKLIKKENNLGINQNLIGMGDYVNVNTLKGEVEVFFPIYLVNYLPIEAEQLKTPYFFMLDENLEIKNLFIPDENDEEMTEIYLKEIQRHILNK